MWLWTFWYGSCCSLMLLCLQTSLKERLLKQLEATYISAAVQGDSCSFNLLQCFLNAVSFQFLPSTIILRLINAEKSNMQEKKGEPCLKWCWNVQKVIFLASLLCTECVHKIFIFRVWIISITILNWRRVKFD